MVELTGEGDGLCCCVAVLFGPGDGKCNAPHVGCAPVLGASVPVSSLGVSPVCVVCVDLCVVCVDCCFVLGVGVLAVLLIVLLLAIVGIAVICQWLLPSGVRA